MCNYENYNFHGDTVCSEAKKANSRVKPKEKARGSIPGEISHFPLSLPPSHQAGNSQMCGAETMPTESPGDSLVPFLSTRLLSPNWKLSYLEGRER